MEKQNYIGDIKREDQTKGLSQEQKNKAANYSTLVSKMWIIRLTYLLD